MAEVHDISPQEADQAKEAKLGLKVSQPENGCITAVEGASFFCKYVENVFLTDPVFGTTKEARAKLWKRGRPDHPYDARPAGAEVGAVLDQVPHQQVRDSVATAATLVGAGRREDRRHGPVEAVRLREERDGVQLLGRP